MGELIRGMLVPHVSGFLDLDGADPAHGPVIQGLCALGDEVAGLHPDAIIVASTHWFTTFHHYVAGPRRLAGTLAVTEPPDLVRSLPYDYPGEPDLARALVAAGRAERVPAVLTEDAGLSLDGDTVVPLRFLTPRADVPVVPISLCSLADLSEALRWGRAIGAAVRSGDRRVILAVTGALSAPTGRSSPAPAPASRAGDDRSGPVPAGAGGRHLALLAGALGSGSAGSVPGPGGRRAVATLSPE